MHTIEDLNLGDVIVTQITKYHERPHFGAGKIHEYAVYTVTGTAGDGITLNGGTHALTQPSKPGAYAILEFPNTYRSRFYAVQGLFRRATSWKVDRIATFTGDDANREADSYVSLLNKARELLANADISSALQEKPHVATQEEAHILIALASKHIQQDTTSTLRALKSARGKMKKVATKISKTPGKSSVSDKASNAPLRILANQEGTLTCYGFTEGSIIKLTTITTTATLQVAGGDNAAIRLSDRKGSPAGTITLQRKHFGHEDEVATRELIVTLDDEDEDAYVLCSGCSDPEWLVDVLMFTPANGKAEPIEEYVANQSMSFPQEETSAKSEAWQERQLESIHRSLDDACILCKKHGFNNAHSSIYSAYNEVYDVMHGKVSAAHIQHLNRSLQNVLDSAMLEVQHGSKARITEVENIISELVAINERVSAQQLKCPHTPYFTPHGTLNKGTHNSLVVGSSPTRPTLTKGIH